MEADETRPKRKSFGSFISPGPYQKPLSIAIPPLTTGTYNFKEVGYIYFKDNLTTMNYDV